jgi:hypothetical protein
MAKLLKGIVRPGGYAIEVDADSLGGGSEGGTGLQLLTFDFNYASEQMEQGLDVYIPAPGDWLYDGWVDVLTPFDGTTPQVDFSVTPTPLGLFAGQGSTFKLDTPTKTNGFSNDDRQGQGNFMSQNNTARIVPARFIDGTSFKMYVTQDGKCDGTGTPIDSMVGEARLYLAILPSLFL